MLSARLGYPDRALLSSPVLLGSCCRQFGLIMNLARTLSPTGKVRVASEGSWADSSESAMSSIVLKSILCLSSCLWHWLFLLLGGSIQQTQLCLAS